jgi:hypothetical protein
MVLADFFEIFGDRLRILQVAKKPGEVDEVQEGPKGDQNQVVFATRAHHGKEAPEGKRRKAEPEDDPVKGEEAEKSEGSRGYKTADLGGIDGIEVEILDFGSDERAFA